LTSQAIGTATNTPAAATIIVGGATISLGSIANDAKTNASAINASGVAGLTASANATTVAAATQTNLSAASDTGTVLINGTSITLTASGNASSNRSNTVAALNAQSSQTGVIATDTGSGVSLAAADGRNISLTYTAGTNTPAATEFGLTGTAVTGGTMNIRYEAPTGTTGNVQFTGGFANTSTIAATGTAISAINVLTAGSAITALSSIDAAIGSVNTSRGALGALQNRFTSVVTSLQTTGENLSASRSRIQDADFASETANLSRAQVLQQAGTAMVAQANQLPQGVLALLR
jgi:flagellin